MTAATAPGATHMVEETRWRPVVRDDRLGSRSGRFVRGGIPRPGGSESLELSPSPVSPGASPRRDRQPRTPAHPRAAHACGRCRGRDGRRETGRAETHQPRQLTALCSRPRSAVVSGVEALRGPSARGWRLHHPTACGLQELASSFAGRPTVVCIVLRLKEPTVRRWFEGGWATHRTISGSGGAGGSLDWESRKEDGWVRQRK